MFLGSKTSVFSIHLEISTDGFEYSFQYLLTSITFHFLSSEWSETLLWRFNSGGVAGVFAGVVVVAGGVKLLLISHFY